MSNVINFPNLENRTWKSVESEVRNLLKNAELNEGAIKNILNEYESIFNDLSSKCEFHFSVPNEAQLSAEQANFVITAHQQAFEAFKAEYAKYAFNANKHILGLLVRIYDK